MYEPTTATTELDATNTEYLDTEPSQTETTNTESEDKATPQELKEREMVASKQQQINEGIISHSDLAPWLQQRTSPVVTNAPSEKESMREELAREIREDMEFDAMKKSIPSDTPKEKLQMMEDIMDNAKYSTMSKPERLEFAKFKAGIGGSEDLEAARKEGIKVGKFGLLGIGNHEGEKPQSTLSKTEAKYDTLPSFLK